MSADPGPRYPRLVAEAKGRIREIAPQNGSAAVATGAVLIDVREREEVSRGSIPGALSIPRGILEPEIEDHIAKSDTPILLICAGGNRSALAAESLQRMGYTNVQSVAGGVRAWRAADLPFVTNSSEPQRT